jgi:hypothetical protein
MEYILQDAVLRWQAALYLLRSAILLHFRCAVYHAAGTTLGTRSKRKPFQWWFEAKSSNITHPEAKFVHSFKGNVSNILTSMQ